VLRTLFFYLVWVCRICSIVHMVGQWNDTIYLCALNRDCGLDVTSGRLSDVMKGGQRLDTVYVSA
jgi:hypothetical protein